MKQLLSVWLVPQKDDEEYLRSIIDNLADEYNCPKFIPHLTLFGDIMIEEIEFKKAIDKIFQDVKKFKIKKTNISQSELFFKTVFVEFEKSETLIKLFKALSKGTVEKNVDEFKPHISLIYKIMPEKEKLEIIKKLKIKDEFTIGSVYINAAKIGDKDFLDVSGWRSIYKKKLNN